MEKHFVTAGVPSDPYLIGFYDERILNINNESDVPVNFTIEADPTGQGPWMRYKMMQVEPGKEFKMIFPRHFMARWIRFITDKDCRATTLAELQVKLF
ncbi:MAG: hypothetical protein U0X39_12210 [Bacteroidales bacterium]